MLARELGRGAFSIVKLGVNKVRHKQQEKIILFLFLMMFLLLLFLLLLISKQEIMLQ